MKNFLTILLLFSCKTLFSQTWEAGLFLGGANYHGDLAPSLVIRETNPAVGVFLLRNLDQHFAVKAEFLYGRISGHDSNFTHLQERNLSFFSPIAEFNIQFEFNFFPYATGLRPGLHTPYTFLGIGIFYFDPQTTFQNEDIRLRPLFNEIKRYNLTQIAVPFGGGYKFTLSERINTSLYAGYRLLFTDYLDDVSTEYAANRHPVADRSPENIGRPGKQRGNNDLNDAYMFGGITISYRIANPYCPYPQ